MSEPTTAALPAPISLTLEEAMKVAGGLIAGHFNNEYIVNGIPIEYWNVIKGLPSQSQIQGVVGQAAF
jgi:hypothetical protein